MSKNKFVVVVQCEQVTKHCSGFFCEHAFNAKKDCFSSYADYDKVRLLTMSCGGCPGRNTLNKLINLVSQIKKTEKFPKTEIVVHLASCVAFESYHGPECPHKEYLTKLITEKGGFELVYGSRLSHIAEGRRKIGTYNKRETESIPPFRKPGAYHTGEPHKLPPILKND
ncbi:MAG TPA: CGGC domain-containing protein [Victivallales bacterium]|nr:CGGC domain-containing protein [Victivallales bacterium]